MTHEFPEWQSCFLEGTSNPIPWRSVLAAPGKEDLLEVIERDEADRQYLDQLFESCA
jgi:hypothetical protein